MSREPLIGIVRKEAADAAIQSLKEEGCYDSERHIREFDAKSLALPITQQPNETDVDAIRQDKSPDYRIRDLDDILRTRGFSEDERAQVPQSWAVIGTVILAQFDECPRESEVGEALLELHQGVDTVLAREGIDGEHREPNVRVVAGFGDTETIHREHGTAYALDLASVMFSPGNKAERIRMGDIVSAGETVFDMFAGIGYFTLPMARGGADVTATERNPAAFRFLLENAKLNDVTDRIHAYRTDCRAIRPTVDRVVMGYYDARDYLDAGVAAVRTGGSLHVHDIAPLDDPFSQLSSALDAQDRPLEIQRKHIVKTHSPGMVHVVIDVEDRSS